MSSWFVALITFACMFSGAMGAMAVARLLPERHVSKETQDSVKLGVGMIAAMASLILGLMTASVKGSFDTTDRDVHTYATYILGLDGTLRHYGPEAAPIRVLLVEYGQTVVAETWNVARPPGTPAAGLSSEMLLGRLDTALRNLATGTDDQREWRREAMARFNALVTTRWTVLEESVTAIPSVFIVVLVVWLTLIFMSFGLFAPVNAVSIGALFLCAVSIAAALFLITEMSGPFDGVIAISPKPMTDAIASILRTMPAVPPAQ